MRKHQLGQSGLEISPITMGCWQAGKSGWKGVDDSDTLAAMQTALDCGINFFDTAEGYGEGHSEVILGRALAGQRDKALIATKVWPGNFKADHIYKACEASLKNLQTDVIDLYQLHWPAGSWGTEAVPIEETMGAMIKLQSEGKIRAIGVSNFDAAQIEEALQYGRIDALQPPYSLFWRGYETNGTIQKCMEHNIGVLCYSPLAQGLLTGKFNLDNRPGEGDNRSGNALFKGETYEKALQAVAALKPIAKKYRVTTGQLALQWLLEQPGVTSVVVGARNAEQVQGNIAGAAFELAEEDATAMDVISRGVTETIAEGRTTMWG